MVSVRRFGVFSILALSCGVSTFAACGDDETATPPAATIDAAKQDGTVSETGAPDTGESDAAPLPTAVGACGKPLWAQRPRTDLAGNERVSAVAATGLDQLAFAGVFDGPPDDAGIDASQHPWTFVAGAFADGGLGFVRRFGDPQAGGIFTGPATRAYGVAVDGNGNVLCVGSHAGTADFGKGPLASNGGFDFDAFDAGDAGAFDAAIFGDGGKLPPCATGISDCHPDIFVVKLDAAGNTIWAKLFGGIAGDGASDVKVDAAGNVYVAATFSGAATIGDAAVEGGGGSDVVVFKLDPSGNVVYRTALTGEGDADATSLDVNASGEVVVAGSFTGTMTAGASTLTSNVRAGFLAKLDANGTAASGAALGGSKTVQIASIRWAPGSDFFVAGNFEGSLALGGVQVSSVGAQDGFVARLDATGGAKWAKALGSGSNDRANALAVLGNVVHVTGEIGPGASVDFGGGPLKGRTDDGVFVVTFDLDGAHQCSRIYVGNRVGDGPGGAQGAGVAASSDGRVFVGGSYGSGLDFGEGITLGGGASEDPFVVYFDQP